MVNNASQKEEEILQSPPYDASDKKSVNNARKKAARIERERLEFVKYIMSTSVGRKWMLSLLNDCKIFGSPIVVGDPYLTYNNIGEQNIGKKLLQDINDSAPDEYVLMMKESKDYK